MNEKKHSAKDILISPTPIPCAECQAPTYFAIFRPWKAKEVCPKHLLPQLRKGSYKTLLGRLYTGVYYYWGMRLFEPQRAYWETLRDAEKWLQVGCHIHEEAMRYADAAVGDMQSEVSA